LRAPDPTYFALVGTIWWSSVAIALLVAAHDPIHAQTATFVAPPRHDRRYRRYSDQEKLIHRYCENTRCRLMPSFRPLPAGPTLPGFITAGAKPKGCWANSQSGCRLRKGCGVRAGLTRNE